MIEVLIGALLVALISGAVLAAYADVSDLGGSERDRSQADALAQQDEQRLRGLTIAQLASTGSGTGNMSTHTTVGGTTYTITSASSYISGSTGASSCTAGQASSSADEVATTSTVTWGPSGNTIDHVVVHGVVTPSVGGSLIASATTPNPSGTGSTGLAGVVVTPVGPSTVPTVTTDNTGCAIFGGLSGGTYTVSFTPPAGYVDVNGNTTLASQSPTVTATQTANVSVGPLALPGEITAGFSTAYNGQTNVTAESDQFVAVNTAMTPNYRTYGTDSTSSNNTYTASISSGTTQNPFTLYPFNTSSSSGPYVTFAGGCDNLPPAAGQVSAPVNSGQTTTVTLPEPAMIILPYTETTTAYDDASSAWSYTTTSGKTWTAHTNVTGEYSKTDHSSTNTNARATLTFTGTGVTVYGTTGTAEGEATFQVDSGTTSTEDFYSSSTQYQQQVYTVSGLANGTHHLYITVTGAYSNTPPKHGTNPYGTNVILDEAVPPGTATLLTTKPNITITDTDSACNNNEDYPPEQVPTATGGALQYPGLPYGTYTVCVDNGSIKDVIAGVQNFNYGATGNVVNADLWSGASGESSGTCT
jgi:hypothetical protein